MSKGLALKNLSCLHNITHTKVGPWSLANHHHFRKDNMPSSTGKFLPSQDRYEKMDVAVTGNGCRCSHHGLWNGLGGRVLEGTSIPD